MFIDTQSIIVLTTSIYSNSQYSSNIYFVLSTNIMKQHHFQINADNHNGSKDQINNH